MMNSKMLQPFHHVPLLFSHLYPTEWEKESSFDKHYEKKPVIKLLFQLCYYQVESCRILYVYLFDLILKFHLPNGPSFGFSCFLPTFFEFT